MFWRSLGLYGEENFNFCIHFVACFEVTQRGISGKPTSTATVDVVESRGFPFSANRNLIFFAFRSSF